jgi:trigger factor
LNGRVETQVEELPENKVRLSVRVPSSDMKHAVEHAASDLAGSVRIPGFRKGKVPLPVLIQRVGRERLFAEAVESHIGSWYRNAVATSKIRPVERPEYDYDLPASSENEFQFTATVAVQPRLELPDWTALEVPAAEAEVPAELVDEELEALRETVAELRPVDGRPAREGDMVVVDIVAGSGEAQRDYIVELGSGRLLEELEDGLVGMSSGETKEVEYSLAEEHADRATVTVKEVKEKILPLLDDELARAASEFDTLGELRADVEGRLRAQLEEELEADFRAAALDALVNASGAEPSLELVRQRAGGLLHSLFHSLEERGISFETYLAATGRTSEQVQEAMVAQAAVSLVRELVLETAAEQLGIEVGDDEVAALLREQGEDEETVNAVLESDTVDRIREDLRMRRALDRIASEVERIPVELARAREQLWTPEKEKPAEAKIWTPGQ